MNTDSFQQSIHREKAAFWTAHPGASDQELENLWKARRSQLVAVLLGESSGTQSAPVFPHSIVIPSTVVSGGRTRNTSTSVR